MPLVDPATRLIVRDDVEVPPAMVETWQRLLDLMAEVFGVPAALIMRVHPHEIEVFLRSATPENVYERAERAPLHSGLYCETVMASRHHLLVPNAPADPVWDHNPDIKLGMIAYLGFPLFWPRGEIFGTMCALDCKENQFSDVYMRLLDQFKTVVEHDLRLLDADLRLRESESRYRTLFNSVLDGIFVARADGRIIDSNAVARRQSGFEDGQLLGRSLHDIFALPHDWHAEVVPRVRAAGVYRDEGEQIHRDGSRTPVDLQLVSMLLHGESMIVAVARDISERKLLERELRRLAITDTLTGAGNRRAFAQAFAIEANQAERYGHPLSLAMLDLDHFKQVNDRLGHDAGDRVLHQLCKVTTPLLRQSDRLFRYGGEEFIVLMPETALEGAVHLAQRIREEMASRPLADVGQVTVSIGVTQYRPGESGETLVGRADMALYAAKAAGRNSVATA